MEPDNLAEKLSFHIKNQQFSKVYLDFKVFFKKLDDLEQKDEEIGEFLKIFSENFDEIIEPERQKMAQMRGVLEKYLSDTFTEVKEPTSDIIEDFNDEDISNISQIKNNEINLKTPVSEVNQEYNRTKHSFMKEKIVELIQSKIKEIQTMFCDKDFGFQDSLQKILLGLYSRFPDDSIVHFNEFFNNFLNDNNFDKYIPLIDKSLDLNPKPVMSEIFTWFKILNQEKSLSKKGNLQKIEILFHLLKIYCEIYPEYFSNHLNTLLSIILNNLKTFIKNNPIIYDFIFIVNYFAKHGEFIIAEYSIDLYNLAIKIKDSKDNQRLILIALKEVFENYPEEISEKLIEEKKVDYFSNEIIKLIAIIDERIIIDLLIDLFIYMNLEIIKSKISSKFINETLESDEISESEHEKISNLQNKEIFKSILHSYYDSIILLKNKLKNHTYLLFKSVAEIDNIVEEHIKLSEISDFTPFQKKFLKGEIMEKEKSNSEIIEILDGFIEEFRQFLDKLEKAFV